MTLTILSISFTVLWCYLIARANAPRRTWIKRNSLSARNKQPSRYFSATWRPASRE